MFPFDDDIMCLDVIVTSFMGPPLFALGLICVYFIPRDFMSLEGDPSTNTNSFSFVFKISFEGTNKIYKEIHAGVKLEWSLYDKY